PHVAHPLSLCSFPTRRSSDLVDLGCGSGQVTLPLARQCLHVLAVDLSEAAIELLKARAEHEGVGNVHALTQPIETFELAPESVRSEEHTSELQSPYDLVCRLL